VVCGRVVCGKVLCGQWCMVEWRVLQGCSVRGSVKSSGSQTFTHFNKP